MKSLLDITDDDRRQIAKAVCEIYGVEFIGIGWLKQPEYTHIFWFETKDKQLFFNEKQNEFLRFLLFPSNLLFKPAESALLTYRKYSALTSLGYDINFANYPEQIFYNKY